MGSPRGTFDGVGAPSTRALTEPRPPVELALLDSDGVIVAVNDAWASFGAANGADDPRVGVGMSYLQVCEGADDCGSHAVGAAIRAAVAGDLPAPLAIVIACDAPQEARSFDVLVSSRFGDDTSCLGATVSLSEVATRRQEQPVAPMGCGETSAPGEAAALVARATREMPPVAVERERIAALLNERAISDLFAVGIGLQGMLETARPEQRTRLQLYVDRLDAVVLAIRTTIYEELKLV